MSEMKTGSLRGLSDLRKQTEQEVLRPWQELNVNLFGVQTSTAAKPRGSSPMAGIPTARATPRPDTHNELPLPPEEPLLLPTPLSPRQVLKRLQVLWSQCEKSPEWLAAQKVRGWTTSVSIVLKLNIHEREERGGIRGQGSNEERNDRGHCQPGSRMH